MRIQQLDLIAFGPFTNQTLRFSAAAGGLHLVYGPNEAGKSTTLRALRQWLFGMPHNSQDSYEHSNSALRVGGALVGLDDSRLECVRRKGRSKTLRDSSDADPVDEELLRRLLNGVDEQAFVQRFGIDYQELRRGGAALVNGGGDLGEVLFSAGAGIADIHEIQTALDKEARSLFVPSGSVPPINAGLKELKAARDEIKRLQLPPADWVECDRQRQTAAARQADLARQLHEKQALRSRLSRISQAQSLVGLRAARRESLAALWDAPLLSDDFASRRSNALSRFQAAQRAEKSARETSARLQDAIDQLNIPPELLDHRTAITQLQTELGSYRKAARDRNGLVGQLEEIDRRTAQILQELGRDSRYIEDDSSRLTQAQRQRIQSLGAEFAAVSQRQQTAVKALQRRIDEIARAAQQLESFPEHRDLTVLKPAVRAALESSSAEKQLHDSHAELAALENALSIHLDRLPLWQGTIEELERLAVPSAETIDRFENDLQEAAAIVQQLDQRVTDLSDQWKECDEAIARLLLEEDLPTVEQLAQARRRRDEGWQLVRDLWFDNLSPDDPQVLAFVSEFPAASDLAAAYQMSVEFADALADRLRREADRVAEHLQLTADRDRLDRKLEKQSVQAAAARDRLAQRQSDWEAAWRPLGIVPLTPREMRAWREQQQKLAKAGQQRRNLLEAVSAERSKVDALRSHLLRCLSAMGEPPPPDQQSLSAVLHHCDFVIERIEAANRARSDQESKLQQLQVELPELEKEAADAARALDSWRSGWATSVAALQLAPTVTPAEANAVVDALEDLRTLRREAESLQNRIDGIDNDAARFQEKARQLLQQTDSQLLEHAPDQALADLYDRLQNASQDKTKRDGLLEQQRAEEQKLQEARSAIDEWQQRVDQLCREAGCASPDELPQIESRSRQRRETEIELCSIEEQLRLLVTAGGASLEAFLEEASARDPDQLAADISALDSEIEQLDHARLEAAKAVREQELRLEAMNGAGKAAEVQEQTERRLAALRLDVEEYIRLKLAAALLRRGIERHRQASEGPVLSRASELFAELTLNSFSGLRSDFDDRGQPVIVGVRAGSGRIVPVSGMSEGSCDQLYLALRLALVEAWIDGHGPTPFIVDDILIMFDDDRAAAALRVLARLARKTQVIFFTHHEHLLELARQRLAPEELFCHLLSDNTNGAPPAAGRRARRRQPDPA